MPGKKIVFPNQSGQNLSAWLETPEESLGTQRYAIFAHCFTCGKDIAAASRVSRALALRGIAVLRFDFTGLGNSDGDFANTNFSSNVQDLVSAAEYLTEHYAAPSLLIGHSLGGAAVLSAVSSLPSVKAVATIAAPATADHVRHLFSHAEDTLLNEGEASVRLGFREFKIRKQLLDDLNENTKADHIGKLNAALLVFHAPLDEFVSIDEAAKIYQAAKHPKSFISLDGADHLLSNKHDSEYVALTLSAWASRYLDLSTEPKSTSLPKEVAPVNGEVLVTELDKKFLRGLYSDSHELLSDEPLNYGGSNKGPTPYDLLLMALGSCTSMTLRMYANQKKLALTDIRVRLKHERIHADDCATCGDRSGQLDRIVRYIKIEGDLTDKEKARLLEIADRCPVHRTMENHPVITTEEEI